MKKLALVLAVVSMPSMAEIPQHQQNKLDAAWGVLKTHNIDVGNIYQNDIVDGQVNYIDNSTDTAWRDDFYNKFNTGGVDGFGVVVDGVTFKKDGAGGEVSFYKSGSYPSKIYGSLNGNWVADGQIAQWSNRWDYIHTPRTSAWQTHYDYKANVWGEEAKFDENNQKFYDHVTGEAGVKRLDTKLKSGLIEEIGGFIVDKAKGMKNAIRVMGLQEAAVGIVKNVDTACENGKAHYACKEVAGALAGISNDIASVGFHEEHYITVDGNGSHYWTHKGEYKHGRKVFETLVTVVANGSTYTDKKRYDRLEQQYSYRDGYEHNIEYTEDNIGNFEDAIEGISQVAGAYKELSVGAADADVEHIMYKSADGTSSSRWEEDPSYVPGWDTSVHGYAYRKVDVNGDFVANSKAKKNYLLATWVTTTDGEVRGTHFEAESYDFDFEDILME